jgi:hypothetical protein
MENLNLIYENIKGLRDYYRHLLLRQLKRSMTLEEAQILNFFIQHLKEYPKLNRIIGQGISLTSYIEQRMPVIKQVGGNTYMKYLTPIYYDTEKLIAEIFKKEKEVYGDE